MTESENKNESNLAISSTQGSETLEAKALNYERIKCLDGIVRQFSFNMEAYTFATKHFKRLNNIAEGKHADLFSMVDMSILDQLDSEEVAVFFHAMGLTDAKDRREDDWSIEKVVKVLDFKDVQFLRLLILQAIVDAVPGEEIRKKLSRLIAQTKEAVGDQAETERLNKSLSDLVK